MTRKDARLLPVIEWEGRELLVDIDARQFRDMNDTAGSIGMHSRQGRSIVRQMQGTEWHMYAVDSGGHTDATV